MNNAAVTLVKGVYDEMSVVVSRSGGFATPDMIISAHHFEKLIEDYYEQKKAFEEKK